MGVLNYSFFKYITLKMLKQQQQQQLNIFL